MNIEQIEQEAERSSVDYYLASGMQHSANGDSEKALKSFINAVEIEPCSHLAHYQIGVVLNGSFLPMEAHPAYARALAIKPDFEPALINMARLLFSSDDIAGSTFYANKLLSLDPSSYAILLRAACLLPIMPETQKEIDDALNNFDLALSGERAAVHSSDRIMIPPFRLAYRYGDHTERLKRYSACTVPMAIEKPYCRQSGRIRLMVVVGARYDSVWKIILQGLLTHIDRAKFEIVILTSGLIDAGNNEAIKNLADIYHGECCSIESAVNIIKESSPDVIFYPEIGMEEIAFRLSSMRMAPLQVVSWGHPITTGMTEIDIFFSGELIEPTDADSHYTEKLIKLPGTGALTLTPEPVLAIPYALDAGVTRFVMCQNPIKFDPSDDEIYISIAKAVGSCEFWLPMSPLADDRYVKLKRRLTKAFWDGGLDPYVYLREFPVLNNEGFAGLLDEMDVYLDCPCFSGYTTAYKAIQRGMPIVTLEGDFMRQRLAAGLLRQIGRADTIASTRDEYVELAVRLAKESPADRAIRREAIKKSAYLADNNILVVREFERALIEGLMEQVDIYSSRSMSKTNKHLTI